MTFWINKLPIEIPGINDSPQRIFFVITGYIFPTRVGKEGDNILSNVYINQSINVSADTENITTKKNRRKLITFHFYKAK